MINYEHITNTPFTIVNKEQKYFIVMGDYQLTLPTKTKKETLQKLETHKWEILSTMIISMIQKHKQLTANIQK